MTDSRIDILVFGVDDDEIVEAKLIEQMRIHNIPFTMFRDADLFLKNLHRKPDIVFIDYRLPGALNGVELTKLVTTDNPDCKVIMISGIRDFDVLHSFHNEAGGSVWIKKGDNYDFVKDLFFVIEDLIAYSKRKLVTQNLINALKLEREERKRKRSEVPIEDTNTNI